MKANTVNTNSSNSSFLKNNAGIKRLLKTTALTAAGTLVFFAANDAKADNWVDLTTTAGQTTTDLSVANETNIGIGGNGRAVMEGDLDINQNWTVNVGAGDLVAIDRENDPTFIYGRLNCAGSCHVLDRNGIIVGETGSIDARSVSLSSGELADTDKFMNDGIVEIDNISNAQVVNKGEITVAQAGMAALVSGNAANSGVINAKMGKVVLAAGEKATLDLYGDGLVEIAVDDEVEEALVENTGVINAEGGTVQITAMTAKNVVDNVINVDGVVNVSSVTQKGGKIILGGGNNGTVKVAGKLDAKGTDGGSVEIKGKNIHVTDTAEIDASANTKGDGGEIVAIAQKDGFYEGTLKADGGVEGGDGGFIETSGLETVGVTETAVVTAKSYDPSNYTTGTWLVDPQDIIIRNGSSQVASNNLRYISAATVQSSLQGGTNTSYSTTNPAGSTAEGSITVDADIIWNSVANFTLRAFNDIQVSQNKTVSNAGSGDITFIAGWDGNTSDPGFAFRPDPAFGVVRLRDGASVSTGGDVNILAEDRFKLFAGASLSGNNVNITSDDVVLDAGSSLVATNALSYDRTTAGNINLGAGGVIEQSELDLMQAALLNIGGANTTNINVNGVDTSAIVSGGVALEGTRDITFSGANTFNALEATAGDDVVVSNGASVTTNTGGVKLTANNGSNDGNAVLQVEGAIDTTAAGANGDVELNATNYFIEVDSTGSITTNGGELTATSNTGFDVDAGGIISLGNGKAHIDATTIQLAADINTSGAVTGTASVVKIENDTAQIKDGIDASASGAIIDIAAGTYNEKLRFDKALTINGAGIGSTLIDTSAFTGYGLQITAADVTLAGLTLQGPGVDQHANYGIKATGDNLTLTDLLVQGFGRSEVDLNGVDGATLTNVTADGQNTAGVGIALSNVNNVTLTNSATKNNNWGGIGLYDTTNGATTNVTLDQATSDQLEEANPIYIDAEYGYGVSNIVLPGFDHAVRNPNHRPGGDAFTFFQRTEQDAIDYAVTLDAANIGSSVETLGADANNFVTYDNNFIVGVDSFGTSMFINPAVTEADVGGTINIRAGTYNEQVVVDKSLDIIGAGKGSTIITAPDTLGTSFSNNKGIVYVHDADAVNISDLTIDGLRNGNGNKRLFGLLYKNAGGIVDNIHVTKITDDPVSGNQHGNAVYNYNLDGLSRTWTIQNSMIDNFQKNGISVDGAGLTANILSNTIIGNGPLGLGQAAQNGIQVSGGVFGNIDGNTISGISYTPRTYAATDILLYSAADGTSVTNNIITGSGDEAAIFAYDTDNVEVSGNTIDGTSWYGVLLQSSNNGTVSGNNITGAEYGIYSYGSNDVTISNNIVDGNGNGINGIIAEIGNNVQITGNTANGNTDTVSGRQASGYTTGVGIITDSLTGTVEVSGNTTNSNTDGIRLIDTDGAVVFGNTANGNTGGGKGIILKSSDNVEISENTLDANEIGIYLDDSAGGIINANTITNSTDDGFHIRGTVSSAALENNVISGSTDAAIDAESFSSLTVHENSITGTTLVKNGSSNTVDASGNYWGSADETVINAAMSGKVDFTPFLVNGTDADTLAAGFQGDHSEVSVTALGEQTGTTGRIQEGVDIVDVAGTLNVGSGDFDKGAAIDKAVTLLGQGKADTRINLASGNGFTIDGAIDGDITIRKMAIDGGDTGIKVERTTTGLNFLNLAGLKIENVGNAGVGVFGDSANQVWIVNSDFKDNGSFATTNRGQGDILFYLYHGDIKLKNVDIENNTGDVNYGGSTGVAPSADYGIQIIGSNSNESWSQPLAPSGTIELDNVRVSGNYRAAQVGIQEFDGVDVTMNDVKLGGDTQAGTESSGWASVYLSNIGGGSVDLGNIVFNGGDLDYLWNISGHDFDASGWTFEGVTGANATVDESFGIENKIIHKMDFAPLGLVSWIDGEFFVTGTTAGIQNAINIADAGDTVHVNDDTFTEDLTIDKALKLTGHGTTLVSAGGDNLITVTAADVNIDPFNFDGNGTALYGINANGANNLIVDGNDFTGFVKSNIFVQNSSDVQIFGNTMSGAEKGVYADNATDIQIRNNTISGTTESGIHVANSPGNGYDGSGNDVDIWSNVINVAAKKGIFIENSAYATIGDHPSNPFVSGFSGANTISGGYNAIVIKDSSNAYVSYNIVYSIDGTAVLVDGGSDVQVLNNKIGANGGNNNIGGEGIWIDGSNGSLVADNDISNTKENGIKATFSNDGKIQGNTVSKTGFNGIAILDSNNVTVNKANIVNNTSAAGITLNRTTNSKIAKNTIKNIGGSGIWINEADGATIAKNIIDGTWKNGSRATGSGIHVVATENAVINKNTIDNTGRGGDGIYAETVTTQITVTDNKIGQNGGARNISGDGIQIDNLDGTGGLATVTGNKVENTQIDGIFVNALDNVVLSGNKVKDIDGDGINVQRYLFATVNDNIVRRTGYSGIYADGYNDEGRGSEINIYGNFIRKAGDSGIEVGYTDYVTIDSLNDVAKVNVDGINVYNSGVVNVNNNTVKRTGDDGIEVMNSGFATVIGNTLTKIGLYSSGGETLPPIYTFELSDSFYDPYGADAISIMNVAGTNGGIGGSFSTLSTAGSFSPFDTHVIIQENTIDTVVDDGIQVLDSGNTLIDQNNQISNIGVDSEDAVGSVDEYGADGIFVDADVIYSGGYGPGPFPDTAFASQIINGPILKMDATGYVPRVEITGNTITDVADDGIEVRGPGMELLIDGNGITNASDDGIAIVANNRSIILDRPVELGNSFAIEIFDPEFPIRELPLSMASFEFNSEITGNTVTNSGTHGLNVAGNGHTNVDVNDNTFIDNPVGARFESGEIDLSDLENPNSFTNTNPLGLPVGLQFDGNPELLTIADQTIGATTFDGFANIGSFYVRFEDGSILSPATNAPLLINGLNAQYDGITLPADGIITQTTLDYLEGRIYDADDSPFNLRGQLFVGFVPNQTIENIEDFFREFEQFSGTSGGASVTIAGLPNVFLNGQNLNNINTFAGGEGENEGNEFANIEPAAGNDGEESSCWSDAVNAASNGQTTTFNFGGSFEASIAQNACATGNL